MKLAAAFFAMIFAGTLSSSEVRLKEGKNDGLYSPFGKRDPFRVPDRNALTGKEASSDPIRKFRLEAYRLRAVVRMGPKPQAMFEDPDGKSHVVSEGDLLGAEGARISRIVNSEVIVTERSSNHLGKEILLERVISLPVNEVIAPPAKASSVVQQGFSGAPPVQAAGSVPAAPELSKPISESEKPAADKAPASVETPATPSAGPQVTPIPNTVPSFIKR